MSHDYANQSLIDNLNKYRDKLLPENHQSLDYKIGYAEGLRDSTINKDYTYLDVKNKYISILMESTDNENIVVALKVLDTIEKFK